MNMHPPLAKTAAAVLAAAALLAGWLPGRASAALNGTEQLPLAYVLPEENPWDALDELRRKHGMSVEAFLPDDPYVQTALARNRLYERSIILNLSSSFAYVKRNAVRIDAGNSRVTPVARNGVTYVPLRFVAESLGAQVEYDAGANATVVALGGKTLTLRAAEALTLHERTYVPLRYVAEALGKAVYYDAETALVFIGEQEDFDYLAADKASGGTPLTYYVNQAFPSMSTEDADYDVYLYTHFFDGYDYAKDADWIYYSQYPWLSSVHVPDAQVDLKGAGLYRENVKTREKTKLSDAVCQTPGIVPGQPDWVYCGSSSELSRVKTDGSRTRETVYENVHWLADGSERAASNFVGFSGEYAFFLNTERLDDGRDKLELVRVNASTGERRPALKYDRASLGVLAVRGESIYYSVREEDAFYRMKLDGTGKTKLSSFVLKLSVADEWMAYENKDGLHMAKLDGTSSTFLVKHSDIYQVRVHGSYVYFDMMHFTQPHSIYRMGTDGSIRKFSLASVYPKASKGDRGNFLFVGDTMYFMFSNFTTEPGKLRLADIPWKIAGAVVR